jgi:NitT/TauT family transport system permease protein
MSRHHYSHHGHAKKPISVLGRFNLFIILPVILIIVSAVVIGFHGPLLASASIPWGDLLEGMGATLLRLIIAYVLALAIGIPLALATTSYPRLEQFLLPIFDILESVPVLVFFPVVIIFFIHLDFLNVAAIFIIFLNMLWNIVFSAIGGLKSIPQDIFSVAHVFKIRHFKYLGQIILPAIFPTLVTGSILAWAEGWNMIIVAEVLHTYVPANVPAHDLFGIGSILVTASAQNEKAIFIASVSIIIAGIMILNLFVWQKLLRYAEKFKFE